jgi:hypothetical protein
MKRETIEFARSRSCIDVRMIVNSQAQNPEKNLWLEEHFVTTQALLPLREHKTGRNWLA